MPLNEDEKKAAQQAFQRLQKLNRLPSRIQNTPRICQPKVCYLMFCCIVLFVKLETGLVNVLGFLSFMTSNKARHVSLSLGELELLFERGEEIGGGMGEGRNWIGLSIPNVYTLYLFPPAKKKWSNKAQNDYEMVDSIASAKSQSDSTLPNSRDNKNAIIKIPDEQNITVEPEEPKVSSQEKQQNNTQPFHNGKF